jgi:hypothetical protein
MIAANLYRRVLIVQRLFSIRPERSRTGSCCEQVVHSFHVPHQELYLRHALLRKLESHRQRGVTIDRRLERLKSVPENA